MAKVIEKNPEGLVVARPALFDDLKIGSSVCVSGVCLSVVKLARDSMAFDVVPETFKKSRLGTFKKGDMANLERAMKAGDRLDGHIVQGHVEGVGTVFKTHISNPSHALRAGEGNTLVLHLPLALRRFVVPKGSIAIDGVSLTVAGIHGDKISVAVIPHTLKRTTLGSLRKGDRVNVETDVILRHLRHAADSGSK